MPSSFLSLNTLRKPSAEVERRRSRSRRSHRGGGGRRCSSPAVSVATRPRHPTTGRFLSTSPVFRVRRVASPTTRKRQPPLMMAESPSALDIAAVERRSSRSRSRGRRGGSRRRGRSNERRGGSRRRGMRTEAPMALTVRPRRNRSASPEADLEEIERRSSRSRRRSSSRRRGGGSRSLLLEAGVPPQPVSRGVRAAKAETVERRGTRRTRSRRGGSRGRGRRAASPAAQTTATSLLGSLFL